MEKIKNQSSKLLNNKTLLAAAKKDVGARFLTEQERDDASVFFF